MADSSGSETVQKIVVYLGGALSLGAITAMFTMWNQLNRMDAQGPLQEQLRKVEFEQVRQGLVLNSQKLEVMDKELRDVEDRLRALERRP